MELATRLIQNEVKMRSTSRFSPQLTQVWIGSLALFMQPVLEKENL